ncbi:Tyrosine recombinase XerC [Oligella ureolytica]
MATITKTKSGYRIQLYINGKRPSATFKTQRECKEWEVSQTYLFDPDVAEKRKITFEEMLLRYRDECSIKNKGHHWEKIRINKILRLEKKLLCIKDIKDITRHDINNWVQRSREAGLKDSSIHREWCIISSAFNTAIKEWEWLKDNPMKNANRPKPSPPRDRLISDEEIQTMLYMFDYADDSEFRTITSRCGAILLFTLETAMRAQEICNLEWRDVEVEKRVLTIRESKTYSGIRKVPLSRRACEIIEMMRKINGNRRTVFEVKTGTLSTIFYKIRNKAGLTGFTFHDSRATACTRLAKKLQPYDLARMLGHKDLKMVMVYYRESAEEIAALLD